MQQMQPALRAYLTKLREEAYIDIKPGFVDTGASAQGDEAGVYGVCAAASEEEDGEQKRRGARQCRRTLRRAQRRTAAARGARATAAAATQRRAAREGRRETAASAKTVRSRTKRKKIKREKIRYGQAPRNSLPAGAGRRRRTVRTVRLGGWADSG